LMHGSAKAVHLSQLQARELQQHLNIEETKNGW
jgi:hypothetical protein